MNPRGGAELLVSLQYSSIYIAKSIHLIVGLIFFFLILSKSGMSEVFKVKNSMNEDFKVGKGRGGASE